MPHDSQDTHLATSTGRQCQWWQTHEEVLHVAWCPCIAPWFSLCRWAAVCMGSPRHRRGQSMSGNEKCRHYSQHKYRIYKINLCLFVTERSLDSTVSMVTKLHTVVSWVLFPAAVNSVSLPHASVKQHRCPSPLNKGHFTKLCCRILLTFILLLSVTLPCLHSHCVSGDGLLTKFQNYWSFAWELVTGLTCVWRRKNDVKESRESKVLWCAGSLLTVCTVDTIHCCYLSRVTAVSKKR